jgi:hypothetical protein
MAKKKFASCPRPEAVKFFLKNAGARYPSGATGTKKREAVKAGAFRLAAAECALENRGARVEWEHDEAPYDPGDNVGYEPKEVLCAVLRDSSGKVLESLCGIDDPTRAYARVVEAELALEAFGAEIPRKPPAKRKPRKR